MSTDEDALRTGFAAASDLIARARLEARRILDEAERTVDLMMIEAERDAALKRSEGEIHLQKARAVLQIAQQRAAGAPPRRVDDDDHQLVDEIDLTVGGSALPGELDRLLSDAVASAVARSVASTRPSSFAH